MLCKMMWCYFNVKNVHFYVCLVLIHYKTKISFKAVPMYQKLLTIFINPFCWITPEFPRALHLFLSTYDIAFNWTWSLGQQWHKFLANFPGHLGHLHQDRIVRPKLKNIIKWKIKSLYFTFKLHTLTCLCVFYQN